MKSKILSLISAKGGSGKTILTATISDFLAKLEKRVLIIDADGSTNGLSLFYLEELVENEIGNNVAPKGIFENGFTYSFESTIKLSNNVFFIPATFQFNNTDCYDVERFRTHLFETINEIKKSSDFGYILIDCQAGSDIHTEIVIDSSFSDEIIIVSEYDPISAAGIERIKGFFNKQLTYSRTWVLLNKVLPEFAESNEDFLEMSKYLPPIIWDAEVVKRYARKEIALDFENGNEYTLSIIKLLRTLFDKSFKEDLTNWLNEKNEIIKKPIFEEYQEIKEKLYFYERKEKAGINSLKFNLILNVLTMAGMLVAVLFFKDIVFLSNSMSSVFYIMFGIIISASIISVSRYFGKRQNEKEENKYEKEILIERLKELELLKHSSIEKILGNNKKRIRKR